MKDPDPDPSFDVTPVPGPHRREWPTLPGDGAAGLASSEPPRGCLIIIHTEGPMLGRLHPVPDEPLVMGRGNEAGLVLDDTGVSRAHARIDPGPHGFTIFDLGSRNGLFVNGDRVQERLLRDGDRIQLGTGTVLKFRLQEPAEEDAQRRLYESATRDALTGAYNRRFLAETLESDLARCRRRGAPLSVLVIDLDHFKSVNDKLGHLAGDQALKDAAAAAQRELRQEDAFARYGGEEFVAVLRHAGEEEAVAVAERIRRGLADQEMAFGAHRFHVTASIGVASFDPAAHADASALLAAADAALYRAKREGRNRVVAASRPAEG